MLPPNIEESNRQTDIRIVCLRYSIPKGFTPFLLYHTDHHLSSKAHEICVNMPMKYSSRH